ncbi:ribosome maturation factor RimP [Melghiribacillus thermohalophilus]|uniref:Ribosome maturation factor RimP n=1 Tax=Melghiribacillus thermohalophilus TaxID=1324956 RepID=A0A4R3NHH0_9BACI|nr:ribosome maturation factor RimP [Melghiribacillus thermohalophilus]TCT26732.1 ribosome maturation factor RimP [Melghiribacillus thermohalophilus]
MGKNVTAITKELAEPILENMNVELVDIEFVKEGKNWYLRLFVDKDGGITIEECEEISEALSVKLDEADPISTPYFLEVSSPGVERPLKKKTDFEKYVGHRVYVKLYRHMNGEKEFEGKLLSFADEMATIEFNDRGRMKTVDIPYDQIAKARLAVSFN